MPWSDLSVEVPVLVVVRLLLVLMPPLVFATMPMGVHQHNHKHGERDRGKDDHRRSVLPGLGQELQKVMDHDTQPYTAFRQTPTVEFQSCQVAERKLAERERSSGRWPERCAANARTLDTASAPRAERGCVAETSRSRSNGSMASTAFHAREGSRPLRLVFDKALPGAVSRCAAKVMRRQSH